MARLIQPDIMDTTIYTYVGYPLSYIYIYFFFFMFHVICFNMTTFSGIVILVGDVPGNS